MLRYFTMNRLLTCGTAVVFSFCFLSVVRTQASEPVTIYKIVSTYKDLKMVQDLPKRLSNLSIYRTSIYANEAMQSLKNQFPFKAFDLAEVSDLLALYESKKPRGFITNCFPMVPEKKGFGKPELPVFLKLIPR